MNSFHKFVSSWGYLPLLGLAGFALALTIVISRPAPEKRAPIVPPPTASFSTSVAGIGVIEPRSELISIGTEISGIVRTVYIKVGDQVSAGDPLFSLDKREIEAQISYLAAQIESAKIELKNAQILFNTVDGLIAQNAVSREEFDVKKNALDLAQAKLLEAQRLYEISTTTRERLTVRAPIDGQILDLNIRSGEFAATGVQTPALILMGDTSKLHVRVEIDEENLKGITPKSDAYGTLRSDTIRQIPLTFVRFEPYIQPKQNLSAINQRVDTRVAQIIYELPIGEGDIKVGHFMDVYIETERSRDSDIK